MKNMVKFVQWTLKFGECSNNVRWTLEVKILHIQVTATDTQWTDFPIYATYYQITRESSAFFWLTEGLVWYSFFFINAKVLTAL